jgi:hypothetical protein
MLRIGGSGDKNMPYYRKNQEVWSGALIVAVMLISLALIAFSMVVRSAS